MILFLFVGLFAAFVPGSVAGDLTSIGTLFAFILVCAAVWILRVKEPQLKRNFKTPLVPLVPILGMVVCFAMIIGLPMPTLVSASIWLVIGLVVYFLYSAKQAAIKRNQNKK
jgi:APA family basic amino acid/polyamine antiporter